MQWKCLLLVPQVSLNVKQIKMGVKGIKIIFSCKDFMFIFVLHFSSLREEIIDFADNLLGWLDESLTKVPLSLKAAKFEGWFS